MRSRFVGCLKDKPPTTAGQWPFGTCLGGVIAIGIRVWWLHLAWALLLCRLCNDAGMDLLLVGLLQTAVALILAGIRFRRRFELATVSESSLSPRTARSTSVPESLKKSLRMLPVAFMDPAPAPIVPGGCAVTRCAGQFVWTAGGHAAACCPALGR